MTDEEREKELEQMAADMEQAAAVLNRVVPQLKATMRYMDLSDTVMARLMNAQIELDNAIERYVAMHNEWIAASA